MKKIFTFLLLILGLNLSSQTVYYVRTSGNDASAGTSWSTAFKTLQKAIATATSGMQIWVAAGTYYPDEGPGQINNYRTSCFQLKGGVGIYGGFAGNETSLSQRDWTNHVTKLSGDVDKDNSLSNNSYHVLVTTPWAASATLDGFTITGGNANDNSEWEHASGGGLYSDHQILRIVNCIFSGNSAVYGGAIYNYSSNSNINNCRFTLNSSYYGGAIYNRVAFPGFVNCIFSQNSARTSGGVVLNEGSVDEAGAHYGHPGFINCNFWGNQSPYGGIIHNSEFAQANFTNCVLWGNSSGIFNGSYSGTGVTYSIVEGGYVGTGNVNSDPLFINAAAGDFHLQYCSPGIEAGDNSFVATIATDLDGLPRIANTKVDIGPYESQESRIIYVNATAGGTHTGRSWTNAFTKLQDALALGASCQSPLEIWVAAGTYHPDEVGSTNSNDRTVSFKLKNKIAIYGGFPASGSPGFADRDWLSNRTILSGEIQQDANNINNSYHVVASTSVDSTAILDGFVITQGNADGAGNNRGAGMYNVSGSPQVTHCMFIENNAAEGGGMFNNSAAPSINGCSFLWNKANFGGGLYNLSSSPVITNSEFGADTAVHDGGGIYNNSSSCTLINCGFWGSKASAGGGMNNFFSSGIKITNCSFGANSADNGGAIFNWVSSPTLTNCILWGDTPGELGGDGAQITWSLVQGGYVGTGNINVDPTFVFALVGDLHLRSCSPAINAGSPNGSPLIDADGNVRPALGGYDMGAYEFQQGGVGGIVYVDNSASGSIHDGTSWATAFTTLQEGIDKAATCVNPSQVWVTRGTYYPDQTGTNRSASFILKNNVTILGGFDGTEWPGTITPRRMSKTVLSGDINQDGSFLGNSYHVIQSTNNNTSAVLDGFIITGGNADGNGVYPDNSDIGGGILNQYSSPTIINCMIRENNASFGGGVGNYKSCFPTIINCAFWKNSSAFNGGGIYTYDYCSPAIINCSFWGNTAGRNGGAIANVTTSMTITNSILWGNSSELYNLSSTPAVTYSVVQGGYYAGANILDTDPLFVKPDTGNLKLRAVSPAIDAGNNNVVGTVQDLAGVPRIANSRIDMGAYEYWTGVQGPPPLNVVCPADFSVNTNTETCDAMVSFTESHGATTQYGISPITIRYEPPSGSILPPGETLVSVKAIDSVGDSATGKFWVTVIDSVPPSIRRVALSKYVLMPANHKMQDLTVYYAAGDNCGSVTTTISIKSNEPEQGTGDGDTSPDWIVVDDHHIKLRAERSGTGTGREYTITITAIDASGNTATSNVTVTVPHDNRSPVTSAEKQVGKEPPLGTLSAQAIPNPTRNGFTLVTHSSSTESLTIEVIDNLGRKVEKKMSLPPNGAIYLGTHYRPGIYFVKVVQGNNVQTLKVIKQVH